MYSDKYFNIKEFHTIYFTKMLVDEVMQKIRDGRYITLKETYILIYLECILRDNVNPGLLKTIYNYLDEYKGDE
ncbi:hypothetical protein MTQ89_08300 [Staphylococcus hyicus]|uniref:hypothetical protein n=1 Tax=Staphylococcus TaxID=1279 RepID=UPI001404CBB6|nr:MULTISPECIES: hypothetical protein [Staphylococcus]MCO4330308.1 hypothetical protein [Staphylococcus hyicus]MCO4336738.1 hypothetical protein [Staphylococcus hyicus]NJI14358.1 hypothetical protein [Staphylococcus agnetis]QIN24525.1 hypothetical protein GJE18_07100 [Staphylococcus agnetis]